MQYLRAHSLANRTNARPAPPQAVLQLLFGALRAQSAAISDLQARVGTLDAAASAAASAAAQLGSQQEEARAAADIRLAALESRLHGASNVAGRQAALDEIASLIGVAVPEVGAVLACMHMSRAATGVRCVRPIAGTTIMYTTLLLCRWRRRMLTHRRISLRTPAGHHHWLLQHPTWPTASCPLARAALALLQLRREPQAWCHPK